MGAAKSQPVISAKRPPAGVLVIDKPCGWTSHDVVAHARRVLRVREIGHAGTLDPMATGVLVLAIGEATKLVPWLTAHDKAYRTTIAFGVQTDTLDADGQESARAPIGDALRTALASNPADGRDDLLQSALTRERDRTLQMPPAYSAIRSGGERAFIHARRGDAPTLSERPVRVDALRRLSSTADPPTMTVELVVGKGYYVRSFARDVAAGLGTVGHVTMLRRTQSGPFTLEEATPLDVSADVLQNAMIDLARAASRALPSSVVTAAGVCDARHGRKVNPEDIASPSTGPFAWFDSDGSLVAVGETESDGRSRVIRGFNAP